MKHVSTDFQCPVGGLMIRATYDDTSHQLTLEEAELYFYPSAGSVTAQFSLSESFMKEHSGSYDSLESAFHHLKNLNCEVGFPA